MIISILRGCFAIIILGMAVGALASSGTGEDIGKSIVAFGIVLTVGFLAMAIDIFVRDKQITTISAIYFGLLMGLLLGALFSMALNPLVGDYLPDKTKTQLPFAITLVCCYVCISILLQTKDEFRFIIPYVEFSKQIKGARPLVLDTSVIIDGRIADI